MRSTLGPLILPERWDGWDARGLRRARKSRSRALHRLRRMLKIQGPLPRLRIDDRPEAIGRWVTLPEILAGLRSAPPGWGLRPGAAYLRARGRLIVREQGRLYMLWVEP